jgi:tetratricopeptide (TPR) repeat protein
MADDSDRAERIGAQATIVGAALNEPENPDARDYLRAQTRLADLQSQDLLREDRLRHWSLRVRHISDVLKLGFELAIAFIVAAIAVGLGVVIWQAAHADGLVIESFNVPQGLAQKGLTGQVIASKLLDRLTVMQNETDSSRAPSSFANDWTNDIKVEIPDTGVSLGQIVRFLDNWLGHQMHLSGELYETSSGVALTVRMDNDPGQTFEGNGANLKGVIARAAEAVYAGAQPYRYSVFLSGQDRFAESFAASRRLAAAGPPRETAWADVGLALLMKLKGEDQKARAIVADGLKVNPDLPNLYYVLSGISSLEGHDQEALREFRRGNDLLRGRGASEWSPETIESTLVGIESSEALSKGDFVQAEAKNVFTAGSGGDETVLSEDATCAVAMHDGRAARKAFAAIDQSHSDLAAIDAASLRGLWLMEQQDWRGAAGQFETAITAARHGESASKGWKNAAFYLQTSATPQLAYALAMQGAFDKADAIFRTLPQDCDLCMRFRGKEEAARHNWLAAAHWFALVSARSPDIPFADTDWGEMLLAKNDLDGAIAKFTVANQKGPHFADPLEMWGEALIAKNRSDLALAKFEEANKYAPNWGRLHLKWGEALWWAARHGEAKQQFALASRLDLAPAEKAELAKVRAHS